MPWGTGTTIGFDVLGNKRSGTLPEHGAFSAPRSRVSRGRSDPVEPSEMLVEVHSRSTNGSDRCKTDFLQRTLATANNSDTVKLHFYSAR